MEYCLNKKNCYFENKGHQGNNNYKNITKKRRKYIACNYDWKEFYSDDENNSYNYLSVNINSINQNNSNKKRKFSQISNSSYKDKIKKTYTINKIQNRYKLENKNVDNTQNIKNTKISNKKVSFLKKNFVRYIDVESYKKYNILNTDIDSINDNSFQREIIDEKADAKCTCILF